MTPGVRVGAAGLPPRMRRETYFARLSFLESDLLGSRPRPGLRALRAWRRSVPEGGGLALLSPADGFTDEDAERLGEVASTLGAEAVVFQTPPELVPSTTTRDRLGRWLGETAPARLGSAAVVWEPRGIWTPAEAMALAEEAGATLALDPLAPDPLGDLAETLAEDRPRRYFRLRGLGRARRGYEIGDLERLGELCARAEEAWVIFAHVEKWRDALRFSELLSVP